MEKEIQNEVTETNTEEKIIIKSKKLDIKVIQASILIISIIISGSLGYFVGAKSSADTFGKVSKEDKIALKFEEKVLPKKGVTLPVVWGDLGIKLVESGAIDSDKFKSIYEQRGQLTDDNRKLLEGLNNGKIKITSDNSGYLLNLFWALGLANKNEILEKGEMMDPKYGGADGFASTGGWTIAKGGVMEHYSKHVLFELTPDQQALVDKVSRGIYRPCCGNSVHFPDCNHGMAMLGLLELMASQNVSEKDIWKTALIVNSYWFPDNYLTIAKYMESQGIDWKDVNPEEMLSRDYSSRSGFANISSKVSQPKSQNAGGSGCGIGVDGETAVTKPQTGCGI